MEASVIAPTEKLFYDDAALLSATGTVVATLATGIVLDRSPFYARSGGQPGDTGQITWPGGSATVLEAIKGENDTVVLPLTGDVPSIGTTVTATIDWPRRFAHMRMHSSLHLLCSLLPGAAVTGGQIGAEKSRLDFDLPTPPEREAIEAQLAALIAANHPITTEWVDESVLDTNPGLVRTLSVKPPRGTGRLRLVRIGTADTLIDLQPCGGTHVATTSDIGPVRVLKIENKGKQNRRITLTFGE
jgi:misacylated tRNA(Ala) deacylase